MSYVIRVTLVSEDNVDLIAAEINNDATVNILNPGHHDDPITRDEFATWSGAVTLILADAAFTAEYDIEGASS